MGSNQAESFDRILALESQATKDKVGSYELAEASSSEKMLKLENELREIKEFSEVEHIRHEEQIISLLKMAGLYELDLDPRDQSSSYWVQLNQDAVNEERLKILALKSCLIRFSSQLNSEDNEKLLDVGITLE
jgi:hypothetical protein